MHTLTTAIFAALVSLTATAKTETEVEESPFIDLVADGRRETRYEASCGSVQAEVIDPESSNPRLILSGICNGTAFDVVAFPVNLPGSLAPHRVRLMDVKTGQERFGSDAKLHVDRFGDVGDVVSGHLTFTIDGKLNRPDRHYTGSFRLIRGADRYSP